MSKQTKKDESSFWRRHVHWLFFVLFIFFSVVGVTALRNNNQQAVILRSKVLAADKNNGHVEASLQKLRNYIYAHMNTNLSSGPNAIHPSIQLKYTYQRLSDAEQKRAQVANDKAKKAAENICQTPKGRTACIDTYVATHGSKEQPIPAALYTFDFVSPVWSPDLAGFSLLAAAASLILFVVSFGLEKWLRSSVRSQM